MDAGGCKAHTNPTKVCFYIFNPTSILISKPLSVLKALRQLATIHVSVLGKDNGGSKITMFSNFHLELI